MFNFIKTTLIIALLLYAVQAMSEVKKNAMAKSCDDFEAIADVMTPWLQQAWIGHIITPSGPTPTVTNFMLKGRQPISDFCRLVKQIESLDTLGAIHATADFANKITDNQYRERVYIFKDTMDIGVDIHNATNGSGKLSLENPSFHRRLNRYAGKAEDFYTHETGDDTGYFDNKAQTQAKMARMIQTTNQATNLRNASRCKSKPVGMSQELKDEYVEKIRPYEVLMKEYEGDAQYNARQIEKLSKSMFNTYKDFKAFLFEFHQVRSNYSKIYHKTKYKSEEIKKLGETKTVKNPYYEYKVLTNTSKATKFIEVYSKKWVDHVKVLRTQRTNQMFYDDAIVRRFKDYNYECRRSKIYNRLLKENKKYQGLGPRDPVIYNELDKRVKECRDSRKIKPGQLNGMFAEYMNGLLKALSSGNMAKSKVYTWESKNAGIHRVFNESLSPSPVGDIALQQEKCQERLNVTEAKTMQMKHETMSLEYRQMLAEQQFEKTQYLKEKQNERKLNDKIRKDNKMRQKELDRRRGYENVTISPSEDII